MVLARDANTKTIHSLVSADMYEHAREQTGRGAPQRQGDGGYNTPPQPGAPVQAGYPGGAAVSPAVTPAAAPTPSYQDFESESEDSEAVLDTPGLSLADK